MSPVDQSPLSNPHDGFFRYPIARPGIASAFFERYLPNNIAELIDLSTLSLSGETLVDETLRLQQADFIFSLETRTGESASLYILLEHKSYSDRRTALQLLQYMTRFWARASQDDQPLPFIIPVVCSQSPDPWGVPAFERMIPRHPVFTPFTPHFEYVICDLRSDQLDDLQDKTDLAIILEVLKHSRDSSLPGRLRNIFARIQTLHKADEDISAYAKAILRYLGQVNGNLETATIKNAIDGTFSPAIGGTIMQTLADTWREEGRKEGREEGREEGTTNTLQRMLRRKLLRQFDAVPDRIDQQITQADQEQLDRWIEPVGSMDGRQGIARAARAFPRFIGDMTGNRPVRNDRG